MRATLLITGLVILLFIASYFLDDMAKSNIKSQLTPLPTDDYGNLSDTTIAQITTIETQTREVRGLPANSRIHRQFLTTRDAVEEYYENYYRNFYSDSEAQRDQQFYQTFDFIDEDMDIRETITDLYGNNVIGAYSPLTNRLIVITLNETFTDEDRQVYVHEYTHALQDNAFNTPYLYLSVRGNDDRTIALQSLMEGDATFTTEHYELVIHGEVIPPRSLHEESAELSSDGLPSILGTQALLPYSIGRDFVATLYEQGGWDLVNQAYENLPRSTEHIFHPERYLAGDEPQLVIIRNTSDAWDGDLAWRSSLGGGVLGEFYLREYLQLYLDDEIVDIAATGWGGDNYATIFNQDTNQQAWLLRIGFDTSLDTTEFIEAYHELTDIRLDVESTQLADDEICWETNVETVCLYSDGASLQYGNENHVLITSAPTLDQARRLILTQLADD